MSFCLENLPLNREFRDTLTPPLLVFDQVFL
jgi:hypothetical protein